ncbi:MAG TPA: DUF2625 family protein [Pseudonocardiaceae bacterium]|jgi:hypothetical protein
MAKRPISDLLAVDDPAWPHLRAMLDRATVPVTVLPVDQQAGEDVLHRLQVTARSWLGAFALHAGAVLVDHGWLRMLGGGTVDLPDLASTSEPGFLVIALDVLGGRFAINGGALPGPPREICYFSPETLGWQPLGAGHSPFVSWAVGGGLDDLYGELRWPGWQDEVAALNPGQGLSCYPPLWTREGRADPAETSRKPVALTELIALHEDAARQLAEPPAE